MLPLLILPSSLLHNSKTYKIQLQIIVSMKNWSHRTPQFRTPNKNDSSWGLNVRELRYLRFRMEENFGFVAFGRKTNSVLSVLFLDARNIRYVQFRKICQKDSVSSFMDAREIRYRPFLS